MDLFLLLRLVTWICLLAILGYFPSDSVAQISASGIRTSSSSSRYTVSRTTTIIHSSTIRRSRVMSMSMSGQSALDRPCARPPYLHGLLQFITVEQNANLTDRSTYPAWTTISYVCQDPGRTRLDGVSERRCINGVWSAPTAPTCETVRAQIVVSTSPPLHRSPQSDGSLAVYLTSYVTHVTIVCIVIGGTPQLVTQHIPENSPRAERYERRETTGSNVFGVRIAPPRPTDSGTFTCQDATQMHSLNIVFDDQRYALRDPCPGNIITRADQNSTSTVVMWQSPSLMDTVHGISLVSTHGPGARFNLGKTDVAYNASDSFGLVEVCVFTVTVQDAEAPSISGCPEDIVEPTHPGERMTQVMWTEPSARDNSGNVTLISKTLPGTYFGIGLYPITYTATDPSGNADECTFSITIEDREPPVLICPVNIEIETTRGSSTAHARWERPSPSDNSGETLMLNGPGTEGTFIYGTSVRSYAVKDTSGNEANCSFTIHVKDVEPPTLISCPRDIDRYIETYRENATSVRWYEPVADDNVGISWPWQRSHAPGSKFSVGEHRVTYVVSDLEGNNVSCVFNIRIIEARCPSEGSSVANVTYTWPSTMTSTLAESFERCPIHTAYGGHPLGVRFCEFQYAEVGVWGHTRPRSCGRDISPMDLHELSKVSVTRYNIKEMASYVEAVVTNQTVFERHDIMFLSDTLQNMADVQSPSKRVSSAFVEIVDQLGSSQRTLAIATDVDGTFSTIIQTLDRQITESASFDKRLNLATETIAVRTLSVPSEEMTTGLTFAPVTSIKIDEEDDDGEKDVLIRTILTNDSTPLPKHLHVEASIYLPAIVFEVASNGSSVPVSFTVFRDDTFFPSAYLRRLEANATANDAETTWSPAVIQDGLGSHSRVVTKVLGPVLSASIGRGLTIVNLSEPVVIEFGVDEGLNITNIICVYWEFGLEGGRGDWSDSGCQFASHRTDGRIICHCNHLTNFAVIVDIYGQFEIDEEEKLALDIITRIGCFLSIAGLAFTIITFLIFRSLRSNRSRQILVHLCIALIALYVVFVCGIAATKVAPACVAVAALLHYLVLVTVMWMGVEARHMYVMLVKVFKSERSKFVIKSAFVAWGVPLVAVAISVGLSLDSYRNKAYCFLVPGHVMYYGLLLPIGLILIHNIATFSMAIRNLLCSDMSGNVANKSKRGQIISRLQNAVCMSVLLGLTWSFGFLAVGVATFAFRLLFCLFNSFQGFIIFALFCIRSKEVRNAWASLSLIECNINSQSYRVKEKSYHANSESAWNGPCVIDWGDAPGLDAYMQTAKQRFSQSATSEESRIPTYSISASTMNGNKIANVS